MGGELVVIRDLHQGSSALSSMANSQQQSSAAKKHILIHTKHKFKKNQKTWKNKTAQQHTTTRANQNTTQTTPTTTTITTTATTTTTTTTTPHRAATQKRKKKGRALNKWNSKQRKTFNEIAPEGLPSGDPGQPRRLAFCGDQMTQAILRKRIRNSKRGIRSKQKIEERKIKRSYEKRLARRKHRIEGQANADKKDNNANSASAQEPHKRIKIELGKEIHIATLNIRGTNKLGKREETEDWMKKQDISILALQETKSGHSKRETRKDYTWYFSGNGEERCHHGVGLVIRKDIAKHIEDIEPINDRLMYITIDGTIQINIIVAYMPTAIDPTEIKDKAYENLQNLYDKLKNKGPTYIVGDFNARLIYPNNSTEEEAMGKFTMHENNEHMRHANYTEGMLENRELLTQFAMANTMYKKTHRKTSNIQNNKGQYRSHLRRN